MNMEPIQASSSRILYDVPCSVCSDHSSGKHYGVFACDGCAGFFKRSVRRDRRYTCKARTPGTCLVDKAHRNQCRACRLAKCVDAGMNRDAVQHERGPRNSTIKRQMHLFLKDHIPSTVVAKPHPATVSLVQATATPPTDNVPPVAAVATFPDPSCGLGTTNNNWFPFPPLTVLSRFVNLYEPNEICEAAARLLFLNVKWIKNLHYFDALNLPDRLMLLRESWKDLFVIGSVETSMPFNIRGVIRTNRRINDQEIARYERAYVELSNLHLDAYEFNCLRGLAIFRTNFAYGQPVNLDNFRDKQVIMGLQTYYQYLLYDYTVRQHPTDPARASKILQMLPILSSVSSQYLEDVFFKATIGDVSIETIIINMYKISKNVD